MSLPSRAGLRVAGRLDPQPGHFIPLQPASLVPPLNRQTVPAAWSHTIYAREPAGQLVPRAGRCPVFSMQQPDVSLNDTPVFVVLQKPQTRPMTCCNEYLLVKLFG